MFWSVKSKIKKGGKKKIDMSHDRKKKYVLEDVAYSRIAECEIPEDMFAFDKL